MTEALLVSNALLWILVCALALVVVALTRQIGLLHERVAPVGALALAKGPAVGEPAPEMELEGFDGRALHLGGQDAQGRATLLFFLSPSCPVCATLLPTLQRIVGADPGAVRLVYASDGDRDEHEPFRRQKGLEGSDYVLSRELGMHYEVSKLPFAVLIDAQGTVRAKGIVNTREHVESLFEADRMGVASLQDYLREREVRGDDTRVAGAAG